MTKTELIYEIANQTHLTKKDTEQTINAMVAVIQSELQKGGEVRIGGFGTYKVSGRAARTGRNPATGETMEIAASKVVQFKAAKQLKSSIQ